MTDSRAALRQTIARTARRTDLDPIAVLSAMLVRTQDHVHAKSEDMDQIATYAAAQREIEDELDAEIAALWAEWERR